MTSTGILVTVLVTVLVTGCSPPRVIKVLSNEVSISCAPTQGQCPQPPQPPKAD